jgi:hypothetical protein
MNWFAAATPEREANGLCFWGHPRCVVRTGGPFLHDRLQGRVAGVVRRRAGEQDVRAAAADEQVVAVAAAEQIPSSAADEEVLARRKKR